MLYSTLIETRAYYKNNRRQMAIIFICAIISSFAGLTVLMVSVFSFLIRRRRQELPPVR